MKVQIEQPPDIHKVFVYGTLKRHRHNHHILADQNFQGLSTVPGVLLDLGAYPALIECAVGGQQVRGEVFHVNSPDVWKRLDTLEGHPDHYKRTPVFLNPGHGWAYTYYYQHYKKGNDFRNWNISLGADWFSGDTKMPFFGFRDTMDGMQKLSGIVHVTDVEMGFTGLINTWTGSAVNPLFGAKKPHYRFVQTEGVWRRAPEGDVPTIIVPETVVAGPQTLLLPSPRVPAVIDAKKIDPQNVSDPDDPGEETIS